MTHHTDDLLECTAPHTGINLLTMKQLVRLLFKTIRIIVGPILLLVEWITTPKGLTRGAAEQQAVYEATRQLTLYQFKTCPFCMKVRRASKRLSLNIEKRDAQHDADARQELLQATGKTQVPCLRIVGADGSVRWMQDSGAIIQYLQERFAH